MKNRSRFIFKDNQDFALHHLGTALWVVRYYGETARPHHLPLSIKLVHRDGGWEFGHHEMGTPRFDTLRTCALEAAKTLLDVVERAKLSDAEMRLARSANVD